jgi:hypothetical protein
MTDEISKAIAAALTPGPVVEAIAAPVIPPHIAQNLLVFLERVKCDGQEAIAWVEAHAFLQPHAAKPAGVPFTGVTPT